MSKLKEYTYTVGAIGLIVAALIGSTFQEIGGAMSGVITQLGLCKDGDSICLLRYWFLILGTILALGVLIDLIVKWRSRKSNRITSKKAMQDLIELSERNRLRKSNAVHLEYRVNANSNVVNNYLLQNYVNQGLFPFERQIRFRNEKYIANIFRSFSPDNTSVFQYGFIAEGVKEIEEDDGVVVETIDELFEVTISQGQEGASLLSFDTHHKHCHMFTTELVQELRKAFEIKLVH